MAEQQLVTIREIAEVVLGNPYSEGTMVEHLTAAGVKFHDDWAGRQCITTRDARTYLSDLVRERKAAEERYLRDRALHMQTENAQQDRDRLYEAEYRRQLSAGESKAEATRLAREAVVAAEAELPTEVRSRLRWLTLTHLI